MRLLTPRIFTILGIYEFAITALDVFFVKQQSPARLSIHVILGAAALIAAYKLKKEQSA